MRATDKLNVALARIENDLSMIRDHSSNESYHPATDEDWRKLLKHLGTLAKLGLIACNEARDELLEIQSIRNQVLEQL